MKYIYWSDICMMDCFAIGKCLVFIAAVVDWTAEYQTSIALWENSYIGILIATML